MSFVGTDGVFETSAVHICCTECCVGNVVASNIIIGDPIIGKIREIILLENQQIFFLCQHLVVEWHNAVLNTYRVFKVS